MPKVLVDETLQMDFEIDNFTDPWKEPDTLILQHGAFHINRMWYAWVPILARHFQVIRCSFRGYDDSSEPPANYAWSMKGLATDLKNFMDILGLGRVHLVGESTGGILAYHFGHHFQERLKTLTICHAPPTLKGSSVIDRYHILEIIKSKGIAAASEVLNDAGTLGRIPDPKHLEWLKKVKKNCRTAGTVGIIEAACEEVSEEFLSKIETPTLLLVGEYSSLPGSPKAMSSVRDHLPQAELRILPDVSGLAAFEAPERCAKEVLRFINKHIGKG